MLNLREYRPRPDRLADHLPWAALVAPGTVLNKDGSFQRTLRYRGPDLDSATEAELVALAARTNNALRRMGSGWALFFEAERVPTSGYPDGTFPDATSWLVDQERRAGFEQAGSHYESVYHLTILYLPPPDTQARASNALLDGGQVTGGRRDWRLELDQFQQEFFRLAGLLQTILPEQHDLDDAETLTYLHGCISTRRHPVAVPDVPLYLDGVLVDTALLGGLEPMLGERHLRVLSVLGFPNQTRPGLLDGLNHLDFPYRWVTRWIPLDKEQATRTLNRLRRHWFAKRKSIGALLREVMTNEPSTLLDSDADNKAMDVDEALQSLGADHVAYGHLTTTVTVWDTDPQSADDKLASVERVLTGLGFTIIPERINAVEAWLGSLPGHVYANVRQPLVHSLNLVHLMPLSATWAGPACNGHLNGPALFQAETSGATPFRFSTHVGDVGHMLVVGPTGAGKSVLLSLMAMQFRRYPGAQVYIFDKGNSARAATQAMGGRHHALGQTGDLSFQPLRRIDDPDQRAWAADWIVGLLDHEQVAVSPEIKDLVWSALNSLAGAPPEQRTLTGLSLLLQSNPLKAALQPYTLEGPHGALLDAASDGLDLAAVQCFEMEALLHRAGAVLPVLTYLFHRQEERFTGAPTLLILDEAWVYLDNPAFAARIREWLKVLRKRNVAVLFATQSLADIAGSLIAPALIESCPQRIFLPNDRAIEPQARAVYAAFGLNDRQIGLIAQATPKRDYYLQSRRGNRLFQLGLGPVAKAFCAASDPASQVLIDQLLAEAGQGGFAASWLRAKGLDWAAELLDRYPEETKP